MTTTLTDHQNDPNSLGVLLGEQQRQKPGTPLLVLNKGLSVTPEFQAAVNGLLEQILEDAQGPVVLTVMSNAAPDLNPYSGLSTASGEIPGSGLLEDLVTLLGPGDVLEWNAWPNHFALFSAQAVEALAGSDITSENVLMKLHDAGGVLLLADSIFLHDPSADLFHEEPLEPHERRRPTAWGLLRQRLDGWLKTLDSGFSPPWMEVGGVFHRCR